MEGYCSTGQSPQWAVVPVEGYCSTGQSPQWAVVPMEEEERFVLSLILRFENIHDKHND